MKDMTPVSVQEAPSPVKKQLGDLQPGDQVAVWFGDTLQPCAKVLERTIRGLRVDGIPYDFQGRVQVTGLTGCRIEVWDEATHPKVLQDQENEAAILGDETIKNLMDDFRAWRKKSTAVYGVGQGI